MPTPTPRPAVPRAIAAGPGRLLPAVLFAASAVLQWLLMEPRVSQYDEGLTLYGAARIGDGAVPYRDFWTLYGPGSFYFLDGFFRVAGQSVLTGRIVDGLFRSAIVLFGYLIAARFAERAVAAAAAIAVAFVVITAESYLAPIFPAFALALLATLLALDALSSDGPRRRWIGVGIAVGATALFRHDIALYTLVAICAGWIGRRDDGGGSVADRLGEAARLLVGCALVVVPVVALLVATVPQNDLHDDLVRIPFTVYASVRSLPFPRGQGIRELLDGHLTVALRTYVVYVPFVALAAAVALLVRRAPRSSAGRAGRNRATPQMRVVVALLATITVKGLVRVSLLHMAPALVLSLIVGAALVDRLERRTTRVLLGVLAAVFSARLAVDYDTHVRPGDRIESVVTALRAGHAPRCVPVAIERMRCFDIDPALGRTIDYVVARTTADDPIYVGPGRHDKVFVNDAELYFLAGRRSATKWADIHPGVQTTAAVQRTMIGEFEARRPALVVLDSQWDRVREPNASAISSGVTLLDDWLRAHYRVVWSTGPYRVLAPIGAAP